MTAGTLVVEAGLRSGSLSTARAAADHARPVGVVPGPVTSRVSAGCHEAAREGFATLVTDVSDALDLFGRLGVDASARRSGPVLPADHLPPQDRQVLAVLPIRAPATVEALADHAGLAATVVRASLGRLELAGVAVRSGSRWRQVPPSRSGRDDGAGGEVGAVVEG